MGDGNLVQQPQNHFLPFLSWNGRYPEIEMAVVFGKVGIVTILWLSLNSYIHVSQYFHSGEDLGTQFLRKFSHLLKHTVDSETNPEKILLDFQVDV